MRHRRLVALGAALAVVLCLPPVAAAHVTVHPDLVPAGAFATLNVDARSEEGAEGTGASAEPAAESAGMRMRMAGESTASDGGGPDDTLAFIALLVGALGVLLGAVSLVLGRRGTEGW
jgi:hypothetical protein